MPTSPVELTRVVVTNRGGVADQHQVRLIEAADMYAGLHRAISYCLLSYVYGSLVEVATQNAPIQIYQRKTFDNCISHELIVAAVGGAAGNLLSNNVVPLLKFCFESALGMMRDREYEERVRHFKRIEPFCEDLINQIEPHVAQIHRPIHRKETIDIDLGKSTVIHLDSDTKDYTSDSNVTTETTTFTGNVTRLNVVTGNGRFYANELGYIIPFSQPPNFKDGRFTRPLSWSLRAADQGQPADIQVDAKQCTSMSGRLKRLQIVSSRHILEADDDL